MKKLTKSVIALIMALIFVLSPMQTFAAETTESLPTEAVYDMEKGGTQHFIIRDKDGQIAEVTIQEVAGNSRVANGDYQVAYRMPGAWEAGFFVEVTNNKFTDLYDPYTSVAVGSITYPILIQDSATKATLSFIYKYFVLSYNTGVVAQISGTELVVSKK